MKIYIVRCLNKKISNHVLLAIFFVGLVLGIYASCIEPFTLKINHLTIETEKWVHEKPLKIVILTDIHMIWPWMTKGHLERIVEKANTLDPDIVVLLGDYVATHPFGVQLDPFTSLGPLKRLKSKCGAYAVIGNHDLHPVSQWPEAMVKTQLPVLVNKAIPVSCNKQKLWITGLDELWWGQPNVQYTLSQVTNSDPVIMLMHNPDLFVDVPNSVALSMAGHTHGGQIKLPFFGVVKYVVPSKYGKRFVYGHVIEGDKDLVVSSGLGNTGIPLRFLNPPEIMVVELKR